MVFFMTESWQKYLAELIGTFTLVFVGTLSVTIYSVVLQIPQPYYFGPGIFAIGITFGAVIMAMVYIFGHISGTHINPAITLSLAAIRKISLKDAILYVISQLIGASIASGLHAVILPQGSVIYFGLNLPGEAIGRSETTALLVEMILTFFLVMAVMGTVIDKRAPPGFAGIAIGLVIAMNHWIGIPLTGASMNPARTFGPALVSGNWTAHWVYWLGPIIGGIIAAVMYYCLFLAKEK